ncbi:MAG TPA: M28 family peptidase [Vicinamibacterales bacterium]|nr:M28 family peptidase [Vicinamibacterales bacterium]
MKLLRGRRLVASVGVTSVFIFACGRQQPGAGRESDGLSSAVETAAMQITGDYLRDAVAMLASDEFEGRAPGTAGDRRTRTFLTSRLEALGFRPGGPGGQWEQTFDVVGVTPKVPPTWRFQGATSVELRARDDFIAVSGVQADSASLDRAEVVFVGYGIEAPEYRWDDFKGVDVKGKVLLMLNNDPDWDPSLFEGVRRLYYGRWTYKYESAARHGAAGAIIIHTTPSAGYPWQVVQSSWSGEQFELPAEGETRIQVRAWTTEAAARRIVAAAGKSLDDLVAAARSRDFAPVPLGLRTSLTLRNTLTKVQTANVAGLLEGRDRELRREVVIFTAHHDHLGIGEPDSDGDRIYNGARDNATGCAQLLAIARALSALPEKPRRSILMLFVAAEEQGLLGSEFYARHPTFPAGRIAANINYDGAGIWGRTTDVTFVGLGKSSLDDVARAAAARKGLSLEGDQFPDRGFYYRSDQFSFAKIGVPALKFGTGLHVVGKPESWGREQMEAWEARRYHQPGDELDASWNFDGMVAEAQLGLYSGWAIAEADSMPTWNAGDEFEAARKAAIAATQGQP